MNAPVAGSRALDLAPADFDRPAPSPFKDFVRRLVRHKLAVAGLCYITLFYLCAIFAPLIAPYAYEGHASDIRADNVLQAPSGKHLFGTDRNGRDLFSRVVFATRTTVEITVAT